MQNQRFYTLNNGLKMPGVGLGVYKMPDNEDTVKAINFAIKTGYRHIDTAMFYNNETAVGKAVKSGIIDREDIFVTTKLWNSDHGYDRAIKAYHTSLIKLGLEYADLFLIHWPVQGKRKDTWKAFETLYNEGKVKSIGVSNYMTQHLEELFSYAKVIPMVNQIELHPYIYGSRLDTLNLCRQNNILPVAYSPLTKGEKLKDPVLIKIASAYKKSAAQILIRWAIQHDFGVIPKSSVASRIAENINVFDFKIKDEDMKVLDGLNEHLATGWDPTDAL